MQDIADLAKVRRPVVTVWRKRPKVRGVSLPFPQPVDEIDGVAHFDSSAVVAWLERTGRGNNRSFNEDAPAIAVPSDIRLEDVVTLLCWHVVTGDDLAGTTYGARVEAAARFDPGDELLLREIQALHSNDAALDYVDNLIASSFGAADALARLESGRLKRVLAVRDLTVEAVELVRCMVRACADFAADGGTLGIEVDDLSLAEIEAGQVLVTDDRAMRRRAEIRGLAHVRQHDGPRVVVRSVVGLDLPDALDRADEMVVDLRAGDIAVLLGPASALCDVLAGAPEQKRSQTLRAGGLVAALRLARGAWREAHRQSLAVWVCRGGANVGHPRVADLGAVPDGSLDLADLAVDVVGALAQTENRAYRYARRIELASVLAGAPLVPRGVRAVRFVTSDPATHIERAHRATLTTSLKVEPLDVLVAPSMGRIQLRQRSLGELRDQGQLSVKRGSRINPNHASPGGTVRVLPAELVSDIALDPFDAAQQYPRAIRTDPGDVIFVEKSQPKAWVDSIGGALVASPARVIRIAPGADFGPQVLAAAINELAAAGSEWESWSVPDMPSDDAGRLEVALLDIDGFARDLRERLDAAHELKKALIEGLAAGALSLDAQPTTPGVARASR